MRFMSPAIREKTTLLLAFMLCCCGSSETKLVEEDDTPPKIPNLAPIPDPTNLNCEQGTALNYENFGEGFMLNHCTMCHASDLPDGYRGGAPISANFDTPEDVQIWRASIIVNAAQVGSTMPPNNNVSSGDLLLFVEWLNCGAPSGKDRIQSGVTGMVEALD
jgi:hypothetical protein